VDSERVVAFAQVPDAIELRHLRAFVAVAEALNFSRAAEQLYISQPALSRQIRMLERLVGCQLFRRSTQRVELTLAGDALLAKTRQLLTDLDEAISMTRSVGGELVSRTFRLWEPWVDASVVGTDIDRVRVAAEELHGQFGLPDGVRVVPVNAAGTPALKLVPTVAGDRVVIYLHGGAHVAGSAYGYRHLAGAVALSARAPVILVDHRLAPENPFPAALDDAISTFTWLIDTGTDPGRIAVVGDSSGGGLVMSMLLDLKNKGLAMPAAAALLCPWIDLSTGMLRPPQESPVIFQPEPARRFAAAYLGGTSADDPLVDPLHADLRGLPPLLVHAASGDSVLPEAQALAERARAAEVDTRMTVFPVATHAFHAFWSFLPEAASALEEVGRFVQEHAGEEPDEVARNA
jgi:acetyl esterase/lipase